MKKIYLFILTMMIAFSLWSQNEQQRDAEVRVMETKEAQALLTKDIDALSQIWSPEFMVNAPLNAVFIGGQVDLVKAGILSYASFVRKVEYVKVLKDVVITMGSETVVPSGLDPKAGQTIYRRYTNIWIKQQNKWILIARHANDICADSSPGATSRINKNPSTPAESLVTVKNNPSSSVFKIDLPKFAHNNVVIHVTDVAGRLIERLQLPTKSGTISLGASYGKGVYFAEINNGVSRNTLKLIKL